MQGFLKSSALHLSAIGKEVWHTKYAEGELNEIKSSDQWSLLKLSSSLTASSDNSDFMSTANPEQFSKIEKSSRNVILIDHRVTIILKVFVKCCFDGVSNALSVVVSASQGVRSATYAWNGRGNGYIQHHKIHLPNFCMSTKFSMLLFLCNVLQASGVKRKWNCAKITISLWEIFSCFLTDLWVKQWLGCRWVYKYWGSA